MNCLNLSSFKLVSVHCHSFECCNRIEANQQKRNVDKKRRRIRNEAIRNAHIIADKLDGKVLSGDFDLGFDRISVFVVKFHFTCSQIEIYVYYCMISIFFAIVMVDKSPICVHCDYYRLCGFFLIQFQSNFLLINDARIQNIAHFICSIHNHNRMWYGFTVQNINVTNRLSTGSNTMKISNRMVTIFK